MNITAAIATIKTKTTTVARLTSGSDGQVTLSISDCTEIKKSAALALLKNAKEETKLTTIMATHVSNHKTPACLLIKTEQTCISNQAKHPVRAHTAICREGFPCFFL
ncbi:MAG: hypothetical protein NT013_12375 [Planctomycetia bacterium]|nr:hypothetical protein [Planctomycetia bacterium]